MPDQELTFTSASDLRDLIDSKQVSIVELTELYLRRIEALNPALNAYLTVTAEEALTSARAAQEALARGDVRGPLHGIPISIKDLEATKGVRSTMGSRIFEDHVPDQDSVVVERVRKSGAIILGKTNTPEFGFSGTTENKLGDACRNPWSTERTSGGSRSEVPPRDWRRGFLLWPSEAMAAGRSASPVASVGYMGSSRVKGAFRGTEELASPRIT